MSGTDETFQLTKEDLRKGQSQTSAVHGGNIPAGSDAAMLQSIVDQAEKDKPQIIEERKANLPLPDDPPGKSDFNSADGRIVNVGSGDVATGNLTYEESGEGRQGAEGLSGLPNDAATEGKKNKAGLEDTTNKDYGYPSKNDPADTSKLP